MDFLWYITVHVTLWIPPAVGYTLLFGKGKVLHFGPVGVSLLSAYAVFLAQGATGSVVLGILAGALAVLVLSALFTFLSLRLTPDGFGILSIALHLIALALVLNWTDLTRGALGIPHIPRWPILEDTRSFALVTSGLAALWVGLFVLVDRSSIGRQLAALGEQEVHAMSLGVRKWFVHGTAFLLLGFATLSANIFFPQLIRILHPNDYGFPSFIFILMIVVAGKPGSIPGAVIASVLLTVLKEGIRFVPFIPSAVQGPVRLLLFGVILLGAVYVRRESLFPVKRTV